MQAFFNQAPFFRFFLPFVFGILIHLSYDTSREMSWYLIGIYAFILMIYVIIRQQAASLHKLLFGAAISLFLFVLGSEMTFLSKAVNDPAHYTHFLSRKPQFILVRVSELPQYREKSVKAEVNVLSFRSGKIWKATTGKVICYLKKDSLSRHIAYGDLLVIENKLSGISPPLNPYEFDYKSYLSRKNIFHQCYLSSGEWANAGNSESNFFYDLANSLKRRMIGILGSYQLKGEELAVVSALLLGYDDGIDSDLLNAYAHTGTLHVLSVSGLHVGVIYLVLNFLFGFLDKKPGTKVLKCFIVLLFLWFYALLSGLSPSVVRAAAMFSMMLAGSTFRKQRSVYNTILVTAFFILLSNPFLLFDTGFQLSYLAVLGIVYFHPRIYALLECNNYIADKIWALTAVSLAAQIGTLPVSLYYFHQFPTYFLISNLVIIPISTVIMYLGILVLCLSPFAAICKYCILALSWSVDLMNNLTRFFDSWPASFIPNINISFLQAVLLYVLIALLSAAIIRKSYRLLLYALSTAIAVTSLSLIADISRQQEEQLCVYQVNKNTVIDLFAGNSGLCIGNTESPGNAGFHLSGNRTAHAISRQSTQSLKKGLTAIEWGGKRILIFNNCRSAHFKNNIPKADLVILSHDPAVKTADLLAQFQPSQVIIDGSNSPGTIRKWKKAALKNGATVWVTKESGAKVLTPFN